MRLNKSCYTHSKRVTELAFNSFYQNVGCMHQEIQIAMLLLKFISLGKRSIFALSCPLRWTRDSTTPVATYFLIPIPAPTAFCLTPYGFLSVSSPLSHQRPIGPILTLFSEIEIQTSLEFLHLPKLSCSQNPIFYWFIRSLPCLPRPSLIFLRLFHCEHVKSVSQFSPQVVLP